jgi:RHS repeat-associated protein
VSFHGKEADATGLQYFGARYYDPVLGRFLGVDPAGFDEGNVHSANRYAYGNNNPLKFKDHDGKQAAFIAPLALAAAALYIAGSYKPSVLGGYGANSRSDLGPTIIFNENADNGGWKGSSTDGSSATGQGAATDNSGNHQGFERDKRRFFDKGQRERARDRSRDADGEPTCEYCGVKTTNEPGKPNSSQIDHVVPWARGGRTADDNAANSCATCNPSKGAKALGTEWIPPNQR